MIRLNYGQLPTEEQFREAFETVCAKTGRFEFGNDPRVGTCDLSADRLWRELKEAASEFNSGAFEGEHGDAGDPGDWCSCVLSVLGFEWV